MIEHLRIGKENAVTRDQLCILTGRSDRRNRKEIEELRLKGIPIVNMADKKGYYVPETKEELLQYVRVLESYANALLDEAKNLRETNWYENIFE